MIKIFQKYYYLFYLFFLLINTIINISNSDFTSNPNPIVLYIITGLCIQLYILVKLYILASKTISGTQTLTGAELLRRVITNIIAYIWFNEYYNILIIFANLLMLSGSYFIIKGSLNQKNKINNKKCSTNGT